MKKKRTMVRVGGSHPESPLQQARQKAKITQMEAAEAICRDIRTFQRYEAGEQSPNQDTLKALKELFDCKYEDLFPKSTE